MIKALEKTDKDKSEQIMELTKDEKKYILYLIDKNCEDISKFEGAISDDGWIYETYDIANSIREKFEKDKE